MMRYSQGFIQGLTLWRPLGTRDSSTPLLIPASLNLRQGRHGIRLVWGSLVRSSYRKRGPFAPECIARNAAIALVLNDGEDPGSMRPCHPLNQKPLALG